MSTGSGSKAIVIAMGMALVSAGVASAQSDADWSLEFDEAANRFVAKASEGTLCDSYGEGAVVTDAGDGCQYAPTTLSFLPALGFGGDASGFTVTDRTDDVMVFMESRPADPQRYDITGLDWAVIEADEALMQGAVETAGAVTGEAFDDKPGPRVATFVHLSEPPVLEGDSLSMNTNTFADDDINNDFVRSLDSSFPNGSGDTNVSAGWSYLDDPTVRSHAVNVWSNAAQDLLPGNIVAGPSEDPPGVWALTGPEHFSDRVNVVVLTAPLDVPLLIDRVEGTRGSFASFELDGTTQMYLDGFTMDGTAKVPGADFQLVFHTPYALLFEGGTANIGFLIDAQEDTFSKGFETTDRTLSLGLSLPTGATGLTSIEFAPAEEATVEVANSDKPVALDEWLQGGQLAEFNEAVAEILALSMSSRFELAESQEVSLGAPPS
jgi:hypothetical protein